MTGRAVLVLLISVQCASLYAATLFDLNGRPLSENEIEIVYREKYYENRAYYGWYIFGGETDLPAYLQSSMAKGMKHNFLIKYGFSAETVLSADFHYLYQRKDSIDYNNLQYALVSASRRLPYNFSVSAGIKIPFKNDITDNVYFYDHEDELDLVFSAANRKEEGMFRYLLQLSGERTVYTDRDYQWEMVMTGAAGIKFFENEWQKVSFFLEGRYRAKNYISRQETLAYLVPQLEIEFTDNLHLVVGVEVLLHACNVFAQAADRILYLVSAGYKIDIAAVQEEKEKEDKKEIKSWRDQDIDEEMVPDWWKEGGA